MFHRLSYGSLVIVMLTALIMTDWLLSGGSQHPAIQPLYESLGKTPVGSFLRYGSLIPLIVAGLVAVGSLELARMTRGIGYVLPAKWICFCSVLFVLSPWLFVVTAGPEMRLGYEGLLWQILLLIAVVLVTGFLFLARKPESSTFPALTMALFAIVYCGFLGSFLVMIRCDEGLPAGKGAWLVLILLLIIKASDISAFFTGSLIGGPKLIPWISPGKTISGAIGGVAGSVLVAWGMWKLGQEAIRVVSSAEVQVDGWMQASDIFSPLATMAFWQVIVLGATMAVVGQLGDLVESVIKRSTAMKDSGALIPSFGGILDLIDSPLAAVPVAWVLLRHVWHVI